MEINWHTEETIRWCWNTPSYKSDLIKLLDNEEYFTLKVKNCILKFNRQLPDDMNVEDSKVDFKLVHAKFCQLSNVPCSYDLPIPHIDFLDDYDGIEELKIKNIQYYRNEDCIDCRQCIDDDLDICVWDDSQIVSITASRFENGEWVQYEITDEDEIRRHVEEERRKEKEAQDRQWLRDLIRDMYQK